MRITRLERPMSLDEARRLISDEGGIPIGGGVWLRMAPRTIKLGVDLSGLGLRFIKKSDDRIEIGAMATARDVETSALIASELGPALRDATARIVGVQMRNLISMGGSVAGRYGFSDISTALLALGARVAIGGGAEVSLEDFLSGGSGEASTGSPGAALVTSIAIEASGRRSAFRSVRNTAEDLAILNAAAAFGPSGWRIAVGARPGAARLSAKAAEALGTGPRPSDDATRAAAEAAAAEISFGDDIRGDAAYRRSACRALVRRAIEEARS